jgi:hypothetical protein
VELAEGRTIRIGNAAYNALTVPPDAYTGRLVPETALFTKGVSVSGSITLQTAACEPETLKNDNGKNALILWLHGAGEGGTERTSMVIV